MMTSQNGRTNDRRKNRGKGHAAGSFADWMDWREQADTLRRGLGLAPGAPGPLEVR